MTMRDIMMVEIYGVNFAIIDVVKEMELNCPLCQGQANADEKSIKNVINKLF